MTNTPLTQSRSGDVPRAAPPSSRDALVAAETPISDDSLTETYARASGAFLLDNDGAQFSNHMAHVTGLHAVVALIRASLTAPSASVGEWQQPKANRIWFDTEFIEDGKTIDLISIGMVREDGATYYAECLEADLSRADQWVRDNVIVHLTGEQKPRAVIATEIIAFAGADPEFWAYYADYDWVALCQLFGRMIDLPKGWPMFCRDLKQWAVARGNPTLPEQSSAEHHALADAMWNRTAWDFLNAMLAAAPASPSPGKATAEQVEAAALKLARLAHGEQANLTDYDDPAQAFWRMRGRAVLEAALSVRGT